MEAEMWDVFNGMGLENARIVGFYLSKKPSKCAMPGPYRWNAIGFTEAGEFFIVEITNHEGLLVAELIHKEEVESGGGSLAVAIDRLIKDSV